MKVGSRSAGVYLGLVLFGLVLASARPGYASVAVCNDNAGDHLPTGSATTDLQVTGPCEVKAGTYTFHNVDIYSESSDKNGGVLHFDNAAKIDFYAESIVVEYQGSLIAGSEKEPIGKDGGVIKIHLWGKPDDPGITCKNTHCGIPDDIWTSNPPLSRNIPVPPPPKDCKVKDLPGHVRDCFYRYDDLDKSDMHADRHAYFGHKVLAVSFGGTIKMFGAEGATYCKTYPCPTDDPERNPANTGTSWRRLDGSLSPTNTSLKVDGAVDWKDGDHIVVTTTDYLPGHSEELVIDGTPVVNGNTTTINFHNSDPRFTGVRWPHNGVEHPLPKFPERLGITRTKVDTRAAVALLSRSIEIMSDGDTPGAAFTEEAGNYFGGHTIFRQGFESVQVQGVEFHQLGQGGSIMHYPVHFHMARRTPQPKLQPIRLHGSHELVHGSPVDLHGGHELVRGSRLHLNGSHELAAPAPPAITFVKDCSIDDSMTRWIVLHSTQGVLLERNVGYKSIGSGFYLEDGTETNNRLYANIGIFARAAVANDQNPRRIPGILTAKTPAEEHPDTTSGFDNFPYYADSNNPSDFWIMNGENDFEYNMAAGAGTCGACYWFVPGAISGPSQNEKWFGYASEQEGEKRGGMTPLKEFVGNTCTSAMNAFTVNSTTAACYGVNQIKPADVKPKSTLPMIPSSGAEAAYYYKDGKRFVDPYYWPTTGGGGRLATRCPAADNKPDGDSDCSTVPRCGEGSEKDCVVTVLDDFMTSFNWAQQNFAAIWMRPQWSLVLNSVVTDVQNGGINFVTSGDYSKTSVPTGFWSLARHTVFIGSTQTGNPLASEAGPFNPFTGFDGKVAGLKCAGDPVSGGYNSSYCLSQDDGVSIQLSNFSDFQRFFSVYDGPAYQDSNAYLNIHPTYLTSDGTKKGKALCTPNANAGNPCVNSGFMNAGVAGLRADRLDNLCYLPNAGIGWKQPNGFYYSPAFHSTNLFFDGVGIRHFVIEPLFGQGNISCSSSDPNACYGHSNLCVNSLCTCTSDTDCSQNQIKNTCNTSTHLCEYAPFITDLPATKQEYCYWNDDMFKGFTDIDRETVLNDDDGSLTGLTSAGPVGSDLAVHHVGQAFAEPTPTPRPKVETISVNKEPFFDAPVETPECASDLALNKNSDAKCPPNTANTSPYQYLTTAIYPRCALKVPDSKAALRKCADDSWGSACSTSDPAQVNGCVGVRLYRQYVKEDETEGPAQLKRMMGQDTFQRSGLTVNHGSYYIDTTVSAAKQEAQGAKSVNTFIGGDKYDLYFLYSKKSTEQTYRMWVGKEAPNICDNVKFGYVDITTAKYRFDEKGEGKLPEGWRCYPPDSKEGDGYLLLKINMESLAKDFDLKENDLGKKLCQPSSMCEWKDHSCRCSITDKSNYLYDACHQKNAAGDDAICSWSVKDLDCPIQGCPALEITMPAGYTPDDAPDHHRPTPVMFAYDPNYMSDWAIPFDLENDTVAGQQCTYTSQPPLSCPGS